MMARLFIWKNKDWKDNNMFKKITKKEFEKRFPHINTYGLQNYLPVYLDNGIILIEIEWNGERYSGEYGEYRPVYQQVGEDDFEIIGYEKV